MLLNPDDEEQDYENEGELERGEIDEELDEIPANSSFN